MIALLSVLYIVDDDCTVRWQELVHGVMTFNTVKHPYQRPTMESRPNLGSVVPPLRVSRIRTWCTPLDDSWMDASEY